MKTNITTAFAAAGAIVISSCCPVYNIVPLSPENEAIINLATKDISPVIRDFEAWAQYKKTDPSYVATLERNYRAAQSYTVLLVGSLLGDIKAGRDKPSEKTEDLLKKIEESIKLARGETKEAGGLEALAIKIIATFAEEKLQEKRAECRIKELILLKPYEEL